MASRRWKHSRGWYSRYQHGSAAVVPTGLILSFVVVLNLLFTGWKGWEMVYRHRVGVTDQYPDLKLKDNPARNLPGERVLIGRTKGRFKWRSLTMKLPT
jgi:hypothetical protein